MSTVGIRLRVHGRVQGVGYRAFVQREARARGLVGWVRNRRDGTVEAVLIGPAEEVEAVLAACHKGPPGASVDAMDRTPEIPEAGLAGFEVRPTPVD